MWGTPKGSGCSAGWRLLLRGGLPGGGEPVPGPERKAGSRGKGEVAAAGGGMCGTPGAAAALPAGGYCSGAACPGAWWRGKRAAEGDERPQQPPPACGGPLGTGAAAALPAAALGRPDGRMGVTSPQAREESGRQRERSGRCSQRRHVRDSWGRLLLLRGNLPRRGVTWSPARRGKRVAEGKARPPRPAAPCERPLGQPLPCWMAAAALSCEWWKLRLRQANRGWAGQAQAGEDGRDRDCRGGGGGALFPMRPCPGLSASTVLPCEEMPAKANLLAPDAAGAEQLNCGQGEWPSRHRSCLPGPGPSGSRAA
uniref:Uncharacterized protein n=1 Tax=Sphaerodactylus townsendi TaxID=933632 RepID=A0ACB8ERW1_9SAUR